MWTECWYNWNCYSRNSCFVLRARQPSLHRIPDHRCIHLHGQETIHKDFSVLNEAKVLRQVLDAFLRNVKERNSDTVLLTGGGNEPGLSKNGDCVRVLTNILKEERNFILER